MNHTRLLLALGLLALTHAACEMSDVPDTAVFTDTDGDTGPMESGTNGDDAESLDDSGTDDGASSGTSNGEESSGTTNDDTTGDPAGPWACLGQVEPPAFEPGQAQVDFTVVDFPGMTPIPGLDLRVCRVDDAGCDSPGASGTTDADGMLSVPVPTDGPVYYEVTGESVSPTLFFRRGVPPPTDPSAVELGVLFTQTLDLFMAAVGAEPMPERGHLIITGRDCNEELAAGVRFEVDVADDASTVAYLDGGLPSTETTVTDDTGRGGVLNVPAGPVTITAYLDQTGEAIGSREIFVRPGEISALGIIPTP